MRRGFRSFAAPCLETTAAAAGRDGAVRDFVAIDVLVFPALESRSDFVLFSLLFISDDEADLL